jgi:hypothetical protein
VKTVAASAPTAVRDSRRSNGYGLLDRLIRLPGTLPGPSWVWCVVFFALVLLLDYRPTMFGARHSMTRFTWGLFDLALMFIGVSGLMVALDWLVKGEPSQQFTRTRWFQRQRPKVTAQ